MPGALDLPRPARTAPRLRAALERLHAGEPLRVAFVAGAETAWTLPLYELALMTARWAAERGLALEPWVVTYEHRPLDGLRRRAPRAPSPSCSPTPACGSGPARSPRPSRTAGSGSASRAGSRSTSPSRCRARSGPRIAGPARRRRRLRARRRARPRARPGRRLRRRRHDDAPAQAGRTRHPAGRRRRGGDRRGRGRRRRGRRRTGRCCARCCSPAAARAICAAPPATAASPATRRRGGRRTRSPAASSRPYLTAHPELLLDPVPVLRSLCPCPRSPLRVLVAGGGVAALEAVLALRRARRRPRRDRAARPGGRVRRAPVVGAVAVQRRSPRRACRSTGCRARRRAATAARSPRSTPTRTRSARPTAAELALRPAGRRRRRAAGRRRARRDHVPRADQRRRGRGRAPRRARRACCSCSRRGSGWPLPLYELALLAAHELPDGPDVAIVTPEPRPLDIFGPVASDALARLLRPRRHRVHRRHRAPRRSSAARSSTDDGRLIAADAVIALPRPARPAIDGPARRRARLHRRSTSTRASPACRTSSPPATRPTEPVKQGGLATQQADAAAEAIAAEAGAPRHAAAVPARPARRRADRRGAAVPAPRPRRRHALARPLRGAPAASRALRLWWPSGKIAGRYLTGFLAAGGEPRRAALRPPAEAS